MKQHDIEPTGGILDKAGHRSGMTVPEGYFADFASRMEARLPEREWEKPGAGKIAPRSVWQRIRPYVYLAAMFAGIWCMMNMFGLTRPGVSTDLSIESRPALAQALADPSFAEEYIYEADYSTNEDELMDALWQSGFDPSELSVN